MAKVVAVITLVVLNIPSIAGATLLKIELPELVGELKPYPDGSIAVFEFGTSFLHIDQVRIQMKGTFTPGVARSLKSGNLFEVLPGIEVYMDPGLGSCSTDLNPQQDPFNIEKAFNLRYGATWDFLLDGTHEVNANLYTSPLIGAVIVTPPTVQISEVYMTIEGVVPEPTTFLFLFIGILGVQAKDRNKVR